MKKILSFTLTFLLCLTQVQLQAQDKQYLDTDTPGVTSQIFAKGLVSIANRFEFGSVFSPDGEEFYYAAKKRGKDEIWRVRYKNNKWTKPEVVITGKNAGFNDPFLSPDGKRLYYISQYREEENHKRTDYDIWYSERKGDGWSKPINAGPEINTTGNEYYISFTAEGTMYFSTDHYEGNHSIYSSAMKDGVFQKAVKESPAINTDAYEADVFIAPDESYIIFASRRRSGFGSGDLYISFKQNGTWTQAKNMGDAINTGANELCPYVTNDGKYLLYSSNGDIYWVSTEIFDELR
ncbi:MAG: hypothetical protein HEP71_10480 [Roseivirga sp.]|nr:hypothetical protein [Roseivirga sp.]